MRILAMLATFLGSGALGFLAYYLILPRSGDLLAETALAIILISGTILWLHVLDRPWQDAEIREMAEAFVEHERLRRAQVLKIIEDYVESGELHRAQ